MRSFSVALIGPDGSGKTTISRLLQQRLPGTFKYLYMGVNADSSNVGLPTTRLWEWFKNRTNHSTARHPDNRDNTSQHRGKTWSALRLSNRIAEEIYRHALARLYVGRGFIVLHDRHYKFDFACDAAELASLPLSERLHRKWLSRLYPYPDLVIFLEAAPEILFARKHEASIEWLAERQESILREGALTPNFIRLDASRPLDDVYADVERCILRFRNGDTSELTQAEAA